MSKFADATHAQRSRPARRELETAAWNKVKESSFCSTLFHVSPTLRCSLA